MSTAIELMHRFRPALSAPGFALRSTVEQTDAAAIKFESGTGAPTHTAVSGSLYIRTDATDSGTWLYRNTDGGTTWEAALDTEATELLAAANTWTGNNSFGVDGTGVDVIFYGDTAGVSATWDQSADSLIFTDNGKAVFGTGSDIAIAWDATKLAITQAAVNSAIHLGISGAGIDLNLFGDTVGADLTWDQSADTLIVGDAAKVGFGAAGGDLVLTADGTDVVVTGTGDLVIADSLDFAIGTGKDVIFTSGGTDVTVSGTGDLVLADSFDFYIGTGKDVGFVSGGTDVTVSGTGDLVFADSFDVAFGAGKDISIVSGGTDVTVSGTGDLIFADSLDVAWGAGKDLLVKSDGTNVAFLTSTDDTVLSIGDGTDNFDVKTFGNIATSFMLWDASADMLRLSGPVRPTGFSSLSKRYELQWTAGEDGLVTINASIADIVSKNFEILGTNASADDVTYNIDGGLKIETDGADSDQVIILPHLDAGVTPWASVNWGTGTEVEWECHVKTTASITDVIIWAGLKLTNTQVTATDDHQAFFRYEEGVNGGEWQAVSSVAGTDTEADTNIAVATSTEYHLKITIDASRVPRFYINGALVATNPALTAGQNLIPYIGVMCQAGGASGAKSLLVYGQAISRVMG